MGKHWCSRLKLFDIYALKNKYGFRFASQRWRHLSRLKAVFVFLSDNLHKAKMVQ